MGIPYVMCTVAVDMTAPGRDCSSVSIDDEKKVTVWWNIYAEKDTKGLQLLREEIMILQ